MTPMAIVLALLGVGAGIFIGRKWRAQYKGAVALRASLEAQVAAHAVATATGGSSVVNIGGRLFHGDESSHLPFGAGAVHSRFDRRADDRPVTRAIAGHDDDGYEYYDDDDGDYEHYGRRVGAVLGNPNVGHNPALIRRDRFAADDDSRSGPPRRVPQTGGE
jgi:hypothetical protein